MSTDKSKQTNCTFFNQMFEEWPNKMRRTGQCRHGPYQLSLNIDARVSYESYNTKIFIIRWLLTKWIANHFRAMPGPRYEPSGKPVAMAAGFVVRLQAARLSQWRCAAVARCIFSTRDSLCRFFWLADSHAWPRLTFLWLFSPQLKRGVILALSPSDRIKLAK